MASLALGRDVFATQDVFCVAVMVERGSFAVLLGANVGTTITAWLVSFKLAGVGAIFVILGSRCVRAE